MAAAATGSGPVMPGIQAILPEAVQPYYPLIEGVVIAILILLVGWSISKASEKLVRTALEKNKVDQALSRFLGGITRYAVLAATVIAALGAVGVETTSLVAVFASAGLAVGLALQGSLANFASGVMILFFRPFMLQDFVQVAGSTGSITDIGIFHTTMLTPDNETVIIPNKAITSGTIVNYTTAGTRRGAIDVGVAYGADLQQVQKVLTKAAQKAELCLEDPAPAIAFVGLGASSLDFKVLCWAKTPDYLGMLHNVRCAVYDELNGAGIEIPFSQIVVHHADEELEDEAA
jgi:small conductance mechanosensitive channel